MTISDVRPFVPAADFAMLLRFYRAVGWELGYSDDSLAVLARDGHRFYLQDYFVKDWAENMMLHIAVPSAEAWFQFVTDALASGEFGNARVAPPKREPWGATITYVWDPCGVLLHFTQWAASG